MIKRTPEPKNTAAKISALVTLLAGAVLFSTANAGVIAMPWLAQMLGMLFIAFSIYVAVAYLLRRYTFIIEPLADREGEHTEQKCDFVITERKNKSELTVCRISIDEIEFFREVDPKNKKKIKAERKRKKRYTYDVTFAPSRQIELSVLCQDEELSILITYDERLVSTLVALGTTKK